jgi:hypothetical protein
LRLDVSDVEVTDLLLESTVCFRVPEVLGVKVESPG